MSRNRLEVLGNSETPKIWKPLDAEVQGLKR